MNKKRVTIKDISELAGVSTSTVSRILNYDDSLQVTLETKKKVFEAAEQLSYEPKKKSNSVEYKIGFYYSLSPEIEIEDSFYLSLRYEIESLLKVQGHITQQITADDTRSTVKMVDGIICVGLFTQENLQWLESLQKPLIFADSNPLPDKFSAITFDLSFATRKVLDYLFDLNHTKIGFIGGHNLEDEESGVDAIVDERQAAYTDYMYKKNLYNADYIKIGDYFPRYGYSLFRELMSVEDKPTAIFIANDSMAAGCYKAAHEMGINIPGDVSLIGFNDNPSAQYMIPPLTTVRLDVNVLAELAVDLIIQTVTKKLTVPLGITVPSRLIVRDSTKVNVR
ncbi:LacI family DNA-binding transcriptional regulator [Fundicoccus ignavus]|uniref:LacI family DNA-binding transcriptional regulator n=1 Tax=Fundicoccus ignavus TaxID=2664442 RepID=A0A844C8V2_9LACT|nr:LacI family DNA-binding transcriptional regulator [Fundicoccus ignavus]MRJ47193.1 LacI family DNA-binding transcriptional regulator [Fundicoccus ignavus]